MRAPSHRKAGKALPLSHQDTSQKNEMMLPFFMVVSNYHVKIVHGVTDRKLRQKMLDRKESKKMNFETLKGVREKVGN